jgi:hypothetical protein
MVFSRSSGFKLRSDLSKQAQPRSHNSKSSARLPKESTNSSSRFRHGFSPSVVRKSIQREVKFPATCFIMTAMEFVFASSAVWSLSSGTCSTARSARRLLASKALMVAAMNSAAMSMLCSSSLLRAALLPFRMGGF